MVKGLRELVFALDGDISELGSKIDLLGNVEVAISRLSESLDTAVHRGEATLYVHQHRREFALLAELLRYLAADIGEMQGKVEKTAATLFEQVVATDGTEEGKEKGNA